MCVAEFRRHLIACFFKICCRAFVRVPCCDCMRAVFVGGVVELTFVVFAPGLVCVLVVVVCFVWFVIFGEVSWVFTGWSVLIFLGRLGFCVVFP